VKEQVSSVGAKQAATTFTCADITALTAQLKDLIEDNPASLQVQAVPKTTVEKSAKSTIFL
jgi:hypothetical protein